MIEIKVGYDPNEILTKLVLIYLCRNLKRKPNSIQYEYSWVIKPTMIGVN